MRGKTPAYLSEAVLLFWTGIRNDLAFCIDQPRHGSLPAPIMYSSKLEGSPGKALPFKFRLEQGLQIPSGNLPGGYTGPIRRDSKKQFSACARTPHLTSSVSSQFFKYNPRPSGKIFSPKSDALQESGCRSVWDTAPEGQSSLSVWQAS